jgi:DNA-binding LacI/PurR family transcriptional regulator
MKTTPQIIISSNSGELLVEQLHRQFIWQIASGQLKPGDRLPPIRVLSRQLAINMHTIRSAYQLLQMDGLVQTRQGSGTQVLELDPGRLVELAGRTRTYTIGVILPALSDPFYHTFLEGVEEVINQEQLMLFVCNAHEDPAGYLRYFVQLLARNVDGIIIASYGLPESLGKPSGSSLPVVNIDWPGSTGPAVNIDLEDAGYQAVRHLLSHGHRRIGQISYTGKSANVLVAEAGYSRALNERGIEVDESLVIRVPGFDMHSGESAAHQLMALSEPPTAIFTVADMLSLGVLKALRKAGWQIPEQMALASLGDIPLADLVVPGLTTASLPARRLGVQAMRMLQDLIEGRQLATQQIIMPVELVIRQSCGCP